MSVGGTCGKKMDALASFYVHITYTSCKTRVSINAGARKCTEGHYECNNLYFWGSKLRGYHLSQCVRVLGWVMKNYILRVSSTPGLVLTGRKMTIIRERKLTIYGRGAYSVEMDEPML